MIKIIRLNNDIGGAMEIIRTEGKFYIGDEKNPDAFIKFSNVDGVLHANSTFVDPSLRGKGIAAELTKELVEYATENNYKIKPICSYVVKYFEKHDELNKLLG